jgi:ACS family pantothenate transporter-like MFS transporter
MPITGVYVITAWAFALLSDGPFRGRRWPLIAFTTVLNAAVCIALANLPLYEKLSSHFFLYYLTQVGGGMSGLLFSWASEACSTNNEERSLVIALMNNLVHLTLYSLCI